MAGLRSMAASRVYPEFTRNILTFVKTTATGITCQQKPGLRLLFFPYAIAVVFTNVRTLRVSVIITIIIFQKAQVIS